MEQNYNRFTPSKGRYPSPLIMEGIWSVSMDNNLHSPQRQLIELRIEQATLDTLIDRAEFELPCDELALRRLKKRRLRLRDHIAQLESDLDPPEPA